MTWSAVGLPSGETIATSTGTACTISGTIAVGDGNTSTFAPVITVTDGTYVSSETLAWNVNSHISLTPVGALQFNEGNTVDITLKATDARPSTTLTWSAAGLPYGEAIANSTGTACTITGTIAVGNIQSYSPLIAVTDGTDVQSEVLSWNINSPISLVPVGTLQTNESQSITFDIEGNDSNSLSLTYTGAGLPNGVTISAAGMIGGTIAEGDSNEQVFYPVITATDGTDGNSETLTINVNSLGSVDLPAVKLGGLHSG